MLVPRSTLRAATLAAFGLAAPAVLATGADKRTISETDLFRFVWVADPQISPDGTRVAFVRVSVNKKKEGYDTAIWIVPSDGREPARALTSGTDTSPRFSPRCGTRMRTRRPARDDSHVSSASRSSGSAGTWISGGAMRNS